MEKINTYPILTEVITHYLKSWMRQTVPNILQKLIPTLPLHKLLLEATKQQDEIGWDNLLRGRISNTWLKAQTKYSPSKTPSHWSKQAIKTFINASNSVWTVRNILKFSETTPTLTNPQLMLKPKIIELYTTYTQKLHPNQYHLFHTPIHQRLTFSAQENTHWMKTVKAATKLNKQREKQFISTHPKITKFFTHKKRKLQH